MNTLLLHCRPGFENEVCSEISEHAANLQVAGYAKAKASSACAEFVCTEEGGAERLMQAGCKWPAMPRQKPAAPVRNLSARKRVAQSG
ncbi:hypothetical protein [Pseudomonas sp. S9]|uniref:hypothetical protein n=1 Tax=Pseudomonas sp. S9 TaxID=686578 RepID=UPI0002556B86